MGVTNDVTKVDAMYLNGKIDLKVKVFKNNSCAPHCFYIIFQLFCFDPYPCLSRINLYEYLWVWLLRLSPQTLKFGVWETISICLLVGFLHFSN